VLHITDSDYKNTYVGRQIQAELDQCRREGRIDPLFNDYIPTVGFITYPTRRQPPHLKKPQ
jgi:hypothetical protein